MMKDVFHGKRTVAKITGLLGLSALAVAFFAFPAVSFAGMGGCGNPNANLALANVVGVFDTTTQAVNLDVNDKVPPTLPLSLQTLAKNAPNAAKRGKWLLVVDAKTGTPDLVMEQQGLQTGIDIHGKRFRLSLTGAPAIAPAPAAAPISN
jgi:hypothetical protein